MLVRTTIGATAGAAGESSSHCTSGTAHKFVFAEGVKSDYPLYMSRCFRRTVIALVTATLFGVSGFGHGFMITDMSMNPVVAAAANAMPSADPCADRVCDDAMANAVCSAICASTVAVLPNPVLPRVVATATDEASTVRRSLRRRDGPPDPYPPRPIVIG